VAARDQARPVRPRSAGDQAQDLAPGLFARDGWRCQYCGSAGKLTLDHVVPRSRGGDSVWENVVTSCAPCNLKKGNRLLDEVEMRLVSIPKPPSPSLFVTLSAPRVPDVWQPYLTAFGTSTAAA